MEMSRAGYSVPSSRTIASLRVRVHDHLVDLADAVAVGVYGVVAADVLVLEGEFPAAGVRKGYTCHGRFQVLGSRERVRGGGSLRGGFHAGIAYALDVVGVDVDAISHGAVAVRGR